jgi:hypothetical protein
MQGKRHQTLGSRRVDNYIKVARLGPLVIITLITLYICRYVERGPKYRSGGSDRKEKGRTDLEYWAQITCPGQRTRVYIVRSISSIPTRLVEAR